MDDFPAGQACPGFRRPLLSVVIPVRNGGRTLEQCLRGLRASSWTDYEIVVVVDGSRPIELPADPGLRVIQHDRRRGPAAARNTGAHAARAAILFFLDADVAVHPTALERTVARFQTDPGLAALFGSYDDDPPANDIVSRFRNLLHHFTHQQGRFHQDVRPVQTFWTGCGAIRRSIFLDLGGFDPDLYRRPAIEDIELGYRMTRVGLRIVLARDVLATHLKQWTLGQMVKTDVLRRGLPWMLLLLRSGMTETDLNVSKTQRLSVIATGVAVLTLLALPFWPGFAGVAAASLAAVVGLNWDFYRFLRKRGGWSFAAACLPLHCLYFLCCGISVVLALAVWLSPMELLSPRGLRGRNRRPDRPVSATIPVPWYRRLATRWKRRSLGPGGRG